MLMLMLVLVLVPVLKLVLKFVSIPVLVSKFVSVLEVYSALKLKPSRGSNPVIVSRVLKFASSSRLSRLSM